MAKEGRPLKFETAKQLEDAIQAYFDSCFKDAWEDEEVRNEDGDVEHILVHGDWVRKVRHVKRQIVIKYPAVSGLAYALGIDRKTLLNYENRDEFFPTIDKAKRFIESLVEEGFLNGKINPTAGQFTLKNNWNWKDEIYNNVHDARLTPEEQAKLDALLLNKKDDGNQSTSTSESNSGDGKGA